MIQAPLLFEEIGGTQTCRKLSRAFYARIERDPLLRPLFPGTSFRCAIEEFTAFLVQFLGGPSEDSQRRWWLSLHESHRRFRIDGRHRDAWLRHMDEALDDAGIAEPARGALRKFFEHASAYVIDAKPATRPLADELAHRWSGQRALDETVAAIREGDADRAIELAAKCDRAVLAGVLALMVGTGEKTLIRYVHERLAADPALAHERCAGRTLLHNAAGAGSLATVELLLHLGADPNVLDGGKHTPLYCVGNERGGVESADVVRALVRGGAQVDAHDGVTGATPLHMAARRGNLMVAKALLACGAKKAARVAGATRRYSELSIARSTMSRSCCVDGGHWRKEDQVSPLSLRFASLANRTQVFENESVKGSEFLRKMKVVARRRKLTFRWVPERGSGSHGTLYVGDRLTIVKDLKKELGSGLLSDMLKQLGIRKEDL